MAMEHLFIAQEEVQKAGTKSRWHLQFAALCASATDGIFFHQ